MKRTFLALCIIGLAALSGCDLADQSFSCGQSVSPTFSDLGGFTHGATTNRSGYEHC